MSECPCGSEKQFGECCGPVIDGSRPAPTAEVLMRSRYSAYVTKAYEHLERSLSVEQRSDFSLDTTRQWAERSEWLGLKILRAEKGGEADDEGLVEFSARFRLEGKEQTHIETAAFARENGRWVYAGQVSQPGQTVRRETPKIGRNDRCPCGSGRKYKKCCGAAG